MSLTENSTTKPGVAQNEKTPYDATTNVSGESHITMSVVPGKREVKIPAKTGFFLGFIAALIIVNILLILLL